MNKKYIICVYITNDLSIYLKTNIHEIYGASGHNRMINTRFKNQIDILKDNKDKHK